MVHSKKQYLGNVNISHQIRSYDWSRCVLNPDDPDVHVKVKVSPGGVRFFKYRPLYSPEYPTKRKIRSEVKGFSKHSQRNFRDTLIRLDLKPFFAENQDVTHNNGFFISVDWPSEAAWSLGALNKAVDKLSKRLRWDFRGSLLGAVWKKEVKRNGTPHLHIIALFEDILEVMAVWEWASSVWPEIVGVSELRGVDVRPLYGTPARLINYMLKPYSETSEILSVGRVWGKWNGKGLPLTEPEIIGLSVADYPVFLERLKATPQAAHCKIINDFMDRGPGFGRWGDLEAAPEGSAKRRDTKYLGTPSSGDLDLKSLKP